MPGLECERHPDVSICLTRPPTEVAQAWDIWTPDIVAEVVSKSSERRDYELKREEYLRACVREYWIVDPLRGVVIALARTGDVWRETHLDLDKTLASALLPGFGLPLAATFEAD